MKYIQPHYARKAQVVLLIILLSAAACLFLPRTVRCEESRIAAFVNKSAITSLDIRYTIEIERAYDNHEATYETAAVSLVNDAIEYEIANMHGVVVTQAEVAAFKKHVNENTKAPVILERIKNVFGNDSSSYDRIYIRPKILNTKLHMYHSGNREIHKAERAKIENAIVLLLNGKSFKETSQEIGLHYSLFDVNENEAGIPDALEPYFQKNKRTQQDPLRRFLDKLSIGEMYKNIIEDDYGYRIIRLIGKKDDALSVEAITVNKHSYDKWFRKEAEKVNIYFGDHDLQRSIEAKYSNIWWRDLICK